MHKVPQPKEQARLLMAYLSTLGLELKYQDALEAVARQQGHKNWKTYSALQTAPSSAPVDEPPEYVQPEIPGPEDGTLFDVPVTVDVSMTAHLKVRAYSWASAVQEACQYGSSAYPMAFTVDEGLYRGGGDFYCPSTQEVERLEQGALDNSAFWMSLTEVSAGNGFLATLEVPTYNEELLLKASLYRKEPDNADDGARAQCLLSIELVHKKEGTTLKSKKEDYVYYGDHMDEHLEELLDTGELLERLFD